MTALLVSSAAALLLASGCAQERSNAAEFETAPPAEPRTYRAPEPNPPRFQGVEEAPSAEPTRSPAGPVVSGVGLRQVLVVALTPLLIAFLRKKLGINKKYLAVLAPIVGELINQLFAALPTGVGALSGLAGTGVRQIKHDLLKSEGTEGRPAAGIPGVRLLVAAGVGVMGMLFLSGCAVTNWSGEATEETYPDGRIVKVVKPAKYGSVTWYKDDKMKGLKVGHATKTGRTGLSIGALDSNTDEAAIAATGDALAAAVKAGFEAGFEAAKKTVIPKP